MARPWTKGPWSSIEGTFGAPFDGKSLFEVHGGDGKPIVAWPGFDSAGRSKKKTAANARLLGASDELFELVDLLARAADEERRTAGFGFLPETITTMVTVTLGDLRRALALRDRVLGEE